MALEHIENWFWVAFMQNDIGLETLKSHSDKFQVKPDKCINKELQQMIRNCSRHSKIAKLHVQNPFPLGWELHVWPRVLEIIRNQTIINQSRVPT